MSLFNSVISDRRSDDRHPFRTRAVMLLPDGRRVVGHTLDIGNGGMAIVTDINPPAGFELGVRLSVPGRGKGSVAFEARASVANSVLAGSEGGFRVGLKFATLEPEAKAALAGFLP